MRNLMNVFHAVIALPGATAATAANYAPFFEARFPCRILEVTAYHGTAGTNAGTVTLDVEKLTGTQAPNAGKAVLGSTKVNLKGAINTKQAPALTTVAADRRLDAGDRLCLKDAGTLTAVDSLLVCVKLQAE